MRFFISVPRVLPWTRVARSALSRDHGRQGHCHPVRRRAKTYIPPADRRPCCSKNCLASAPALDGPANQPQSTERWWGTWPSAWMAPFSTHGTAEAPLSW